MKKDPHIKKYLAKLNELRLREDPRTRIREELESYVDFHGAPEGVRVAEEGRSIGQEAPVSASLIHRIFSRRITTMTAALVAVVLLGGGTTFAAESAVPGDLLYAIKIEVNENVKSAFAFSNEAEAELQARLAEERLQEAEELATRGELDAETSAEIRQRLAAHYEAAQERSDRAQREGDLETSTFVRASLDGIFQGHADVLARIDADTGSDSSTGIASDLARYASAEVSSEESATNMMLMTADSSGETEAEAEIELDPEGVKAVVARASSSITNTIHTLEQARSEISAEAYERFRARIDTAVDAQARAQASLREEFYREAYTQAQSALRIAAEVQSTLGSVLRLDIEIGDVLDVSVQGGGSVSGQPPTDAGESTPGQPPEEGGGYDPLPPRETDEGDLVQPMSGDADVGVDSSIDVQGGTSVNTDSNETEIDVDTSTEADAQGSADISL